MASNRIMIVDDQSDWVRVNRRSLIRAGYDCIGFTDQSEARQEFQKDPKSFSLIILDVNLGSGLNGIKLGLEFLKLNHDIRIVFISTQEKIATHASELEDIAEFQGIKFYRKASEPGGILQILEEIQFLKHADKSPQKLDVIESDPSTLRLWDLASESSEDDGGN